MNESNRELDMVYPGFASPNPNPDKSNTHILKNIIIKYFGKQWNK